MAEEPHSFWKTLPGILTAIAGVIGSIAALITALHSVGYIESLSSGSANLPKSIIPEATLEKKQSNVTKVMNDAPSKVPEKKPPTRFSSYFNGRYTGYSSEGFTRTSSRSVMSRSGNNVTGTYYIGSDRGDFSGVVEGNTLYYDWQAGGYYGKGISVENNGRSEGVWGYGNSANNGGTTLYQIQR